MEVTGRWKHQGQSQGFQVAHLMDGSALHCNWKLVNGSAFIVGLGKGWGPKACFLFYTSWIWCTLRCQRKDSEKMVGCVWSSQKKSGQDVRVCKAHMFQWYWSHTDGEELGGDFKKHSSVKLSMAVGWGKKKWMNLQITEKYHLIQ